MAILASDAGADEDRLLALLSTLRSDLIDPTIAVHPGRIVKRAGDGSINGMMLASSPPLREGIAKIAVVGRRRGRLEPKPKVHGAHQPIRSATRGSRHTQGRRVTERRARSDACSRAAIAKAAEVIPLAGEGRKREDIAKELGIGVARVYRVLANATTRSASAR